MSLVETGEVEYLVVLGDYPPSVNLEQLGVFVLVLLLNHGHLAVVEGYSLSLLPFLL